MEVPDCITEATPVNRLNTFTGICGIYAIVNRCNCKFYIGSSVDIGGRLRTHRNRLRRSAHVNDHLQSSWDKYGESSFYYVVVHTCKEKDVREIEQRYITDLSCYIPAVGYNLRSKVEGHDVRLCGEASGTSKLTDQGVIKMRSMYEEGHKPIAIADEFGVSRNAVRAAVLGETWWHLNEEHPPPVPIDHIGENNGISKLLADDVISARKAYQNGSSFADLGELYGVEWGTIKAAVTGKNWGHLDDRYPPVESRGKVNGEDSGRAVLVADDVILIRKIVKKEVIPNWADLGRRFNVDPNTIRAAAWGVSWKSLDSEEAPAPKITRPPKLTAANVLDIRQKHAEGVLQKDLAVEYSVGIPHISNIIQRKCWEDI